MQSIKSYDLDSLAKEYVETLESAPNGLGQHISKRFNMVSHDLFRAICHNFGRDEANRAIDNELATRRNNQQEG